MARKRGFERRVYTGAELGISWLPAFGRSKQTAARPGLDSHTHAHAYEFCLLGSWRVDWWVERERFAVGAGEVFFTRPRERHGSRHAVIQPCELLWLQADLRRARGAGSGAREARALAQAFAGGGPRVFPAGAAVREGFRRLLGEAGGRAFAGAARLAALAWGLLIDLARARQREAGAREAVSDEVAEIARWMREHLSEDYALADLAKRAGYSAPHFQSRFAKEWGVPPGQYRLQLRVEEAMRRLAAGAAVTEIAYGLGFSSSQYFATAFRRVVGLSPSAYRKLLTSTPRSG